MGYMMEGVVLGLIVFIIGMACSSNFNGFMMELVK